MDTQTVSQKMTQAKDFLPINGTDYIEFYTGNAKQAAVYYQYAFGFELVAYAGPETGVRDRASYVLQQNKIRLAQCRLRHDLREIPNRSFAAMSRIQGCSKLRLRGRPASPG